jgi:3-phenylpropionate/trans-cinnamate dioxygenase ferredoxin reductase component
MAGTCDLSQITFQDADFYSDQKIEFVAGKSIVSIDRTSRCAHADDGERLAYEHLVMAVGARVRTLPFHLGNASGLYHLRTLADAQSLRRALETARAIVVVGAGFLGLEVAAIASAQGKQVSVVETSQQPMNHAVSSTVAQAFLKHHEASGVEFLFGDSVADIQIKDGRVTSIRTEGGKQLDADVVVGCIGVIPNVELAAKAGLPVENGIVVDARLRTADPAISALGDCATFPTRFASGTCRLESIQNAMDQARHLAHCLTSSSDAKFDAVPWFWSDQGGLKLQIAGLGRGVDKTIARGDVASQRFSVFGFKQDRLITVESVGSPGDHMIARRLLAGSKEISPSMIADPHINLRSL